MPSRAARAIGNIQGMIDHAAEKSPLPRPITAEEVANAAAFLCTYGTTYHALMDRAALKAGETVLVLGAVLTSASVFVLINVVVDLLYATVDPRIRYD